MPRDERKVVGGRVHSKVHFVVHESEAKRRYGSLWNTTLIAGTVVHLDERESAKGGQKQTLVVADWTLTGGTVVQKPVNIRSVKAGAPPAAAAPNPPPNPVAAAAAAVDAAAAADGIPDLLDNNGNVTTAVDAAAAAVEAAAAANSTPPNQMSTTTGAPPAPTRDQFDPHAPIASPHGTDWYKDDFATRTPINGPVPYKEWKMRTPTGEVIAPGSDTGPMQHSLLQYFIWSFPPMALMLIVQQTSLILRGKGLKETTAGEILKFFGMLILITRYEFGERRSLWSSKSQHKYKPAADFGTKTGMSRKRFDDLWSSIRFSYQPDERPADKSHQQYRWMLVDDFINAFNDHRASMFEPSDLICVDESISRWYGLGGNWINIGLPHYISMDRKPEDGCEIQDAACGRSGVMLQLRVVKDPADEPELAPTPNESPDLPHGGRVLRELVSPWYNTGRIICADSYFASVATAKEMTRVGLKFIGVVKTATKHFPMQQLSELPMVNRGDCNGLVHKSNREGRPSLLAACYLDRSRNYFISNTSSLQPGAVQT